MSDKHAVHYSTGKDDWETPQGFFDALNEEFHFTLDVCADPVNAKCASWFGYDPGGHLVDGLAQQWSPHVCWMNPPYSQLKLWLKKASEEAARGATVVSLIPSRTDTKAWHRFIWDCAAQCVRPGVEVRFIEGRLRFVGAKSAAPFPSALVIFRKPLGPILTKAAGGTNLHAYTEDFRRDFDAAKQKAMLEAINAHLPALRKMAGQVLCPPNNVFARMIADFEKSIK